MQRLDLAAIVEGAGLNIWNMADRGRSTQTPQEDRLQENGRMEL